MNNFPATLEPAATLAVMRDEDRTLDDRIGAAESLRAWLLAGGYVPHGLFRRGESYIGHTAAQMAAVRVVEAESDALYDELEGLETGADRVAERRGSARKS